MTTPTTYEIRRVSCYASKPEFTEATTGPIKTIVDVLKHKDQHFHERISFDSNVKLAVDLDDFKTQNEDGDVERVFRDIAEYVGVSVEDISYTTNFKKVGGSHHLVIPKYWMMFKKQKPFWENFRKKYGYGNEVDVSWYRTDEKKPSGWFRLPNQTKGKKNKEEDPKEQYGTQHKIQRGEMEDFVLKYIPDGCTEFVWEEPEKTIQTKNTKKKMIVVQPDDVSIATTTTTEEKEMTQKMRDYLEAVDVSEIGRKIHKRVNRFRFTTACFILGIPLDVWDEKMSQTQNYDRKLNMGEWGKNEKGFGEGWAWRVLQTLCPEDKRRELFQKYYDDISQKCYSTGVVADFFVENYGEKFIFTDKVLYCYNGVFWEAEDEMCSTLVKLVDTELYKTISVFVLDRIRHFTDILDDTKKEKAMEFLKSVNSLRNYNSRSSIVKDICCKLAVKRVEWDSDPYLIAFTNKIYDLRLGTFVCPNPDDLIKTTTGWAWDDSYAACKVDKVKEIVGQIFPKQEVGDYYLSALSTGLSGIILQNLFIATGGGANGKSVIDGLMMATIGDYGYKLPSSILLQEIKGGANPEIANIHKKRFCLAQEPDKAKKIKTSVVKEITGDAAINARKNYSNDCRVQLLLTLIMECNTIPKVDEIDYAVQRRFRLIEFISKFVSQEEWEDYGETKPANTYPKNEVYTTEKFKEEHRQAFFLLLAPYFKAFHEKGMPKQPQEVLAKQRAYFEGCDDLLGWFNDYFVPSENAKPIPLKRIYKFYTSTPFFENLPKNQKREQKQSWFVEQLGKTKKDAVKQRKERYNGQQLSSDCLVGFVPNEDAKELYNWNGDEDQD